MKKNIYLFFIFLIADILCLVTFAIAEVKIMDIKDYIFSLSPYLRINTVAFENTVDLDNENSDDSTTYIGLDYSLGLDLKSEENGPQAFLKLERNGPYDYDAPLFIHNTLRTSTARVERYRGNELFPHLEEFWLDLPLGNLPLRLKSGLFTYNVGHSISLGAAYENYGFSLYSAL